MSDLEQNRTIVYFGFDVFIWCRLADYFIASLINRRSKKCKFIAGVIIRRRRRSVTARSFCPSRCNLFCFFFIIIITRRQLNDTGCLPLTATGKIDWRETDRNLINDDSQNPSVLYYAHPHCNRVSALFLLPTVHYPPPPNSHYDNTVKRFFNAVFFFFLMGGLKISGCCRLNSGGRLRDLNYIRAIVSKTNKRLLFLTFADRV